LAPPKLFDRQNCPPSHPAPVGSRCAKICTCSRTKRGAGVRLEMTRFHAVADENTVLIRELGKVQERMTRVMAEKTAELERLTVRQQEVEQHNTELRRRLQSAERSLSEKHAPPERVVLPRLAAVQEHPVHLALGQKTVLCVGGRSGNIANYRDVVERVGGRFAHHDGGLEDNAAVLDASLAAADLVICQTGCISHNAYWRVKDFCKRTGKQCVYVESASVSSLERKLQALSTPAVPGVFPEES